VTSAPPFTKTRRFFAILQLACHTVTAHGRRDSSRGT
jgi:hypothetical protein